MTNNIIEYIDCDDVNNASLKIEEEVFIKEELLEYMSNEVSNVSNTDYAIFSSPRMRVSLLLLGFLVFWLTVDMLRLF